MKSKELVELRIETLQDMILSVKESQRREFQVMIDTLKWVLDVKNNDN